MLLASEKLVLDIRLRSHCSFFKVYYKMHVYADGQTAVNLDSGFPISRWIIPRLAR